VTEGEAVLKESDHKSRVWPRSWVRVCSRPVTRWASRVRAGMAGDAGMTTSEYAVGTLAACGFAALLYKVITSGAVGAELQHLIEKALSAKF
jgi:hypothetical protein